MQRTMLHLGLIIAILVSTCIHSAIAQVKEPECKYCSDILDPRLKDTLNYTSISEFERDFARLMRYTRDEFTSRRDSGSLGISVPLVDALVKSSATYNSEKHHSLREKWSDSLESSEKHKLYREFSQTVGMDVLATAWADCIALCLQNTNREPTIRLTLQRAGNSNVVLNYWWDRPMGVDIPNPIIRSLQVTGATPANINDAHLKAIAKSKARVGAGKSTIQYTPLDGQRVITATLSTDIGDAAPAVLDLYQPVESTIEANVFDTVSQSFELPSGSTAWITAYYDPDGVERVELAGSLTGVGSITAIGNSQVDFEAQKGNFSLKTIQQNDRTVSAVVSIPTGGAKGTLKVTSFKAHLYVNGQPADHGYGSGRVVSAVSSGKGGKVLFSIDGNPDHRSTYEVSFRVP